MFSFPQLIFYLRRTTGAIAEKSLKQCSML